MYGMQVLLDEHWVWVAPTNGMPYQYSSKEEAYNMLCMCYPDQVIAARLGGNKTVRVFKFPE